MKNSISSHVFLSFAFSIALLVSFACTENRSYKCLDSDSIITTLNTINSTLANLKGYEPKEPGYTPKETPYGYPEQETFDEAALTWRKFVNLCSGDNFQEAYYLYNDESTAGDFMVCLKHSTPRYHFYTEVIGPMMYEFEPKDSADVKYMNLLKLEYYIEAYTMQYGAGDSDYIPETFPLISNDLAVLLASLGNVEEALELIDDYAYAVNGLYGNPAYTNLCIAFFTAGIYTNANEPNNARKALEGYIEYTSEHKDSSRDPSEYEYYISLVKKSLQELEDIR